MIILDVTVLSPGSEVGKKLGNPQSWTEDSAAAPAPAPMKPVPAPTPMMPISRPTPGPAMDNSLLSSQMTHPIASLSPYQNK